MGMRTADGLSESVTAEQVLSSIVLFGIIYSLLFAVWVFVLNNKIKHGPETLEELARHKRSLSKDSLPEAISHGGTSYGSMMDDG